jgi:hypothetical protein
MLYKNKMPDYTNTSIYKIYCLDEKVKDFYIGYTTNITNRMNVHKNVSSNPIHKSYYQKTYIIIRKNGGWSNWMYEIIETFCCNNQHEAKKKEQHYFRKLQPTMNTNKK